MLCQMIMLQKSKIEWFRKSIFEHRYSFDITRELNNVYHFWNFCFFSFLRFNFVTTFIHNVIFANFQRFINVISFDYSIVKLWLHWFKNIFQKSRFCQNIASFHTNHDSKKLIQKSWKFYVCVKNLMNE